MRVSLIDANSYSPPIIVWQLLKGNKVIIDAEVVATVDKPNGTQSQLKLNNYDNIYCNYFTDYCGADRYNLTVFAQNYEFNCKLKSLKPNSIGLYQNLFNDKLLINFLSYSQHIFTSIRASDDCRVLQNRQLYAVPSYEWPQTWRDVLYVIEADIHPVLQTTEELVNDSKQLEEIKRKVFKIYVLIFI